VCVHTAAIKEKCPWFFYLKVIINDHLSYVLAGTGNNSSRYDTSLLIPINTSEFNLTSDRYGLNLINDDGGGPVNDGEAEGSSDVGVNKADESDDEVVIEGAMKCKCEKGKKTPAWKGKSVHATATTLVSKKAKMGAEKIAAIAAKEEKTTQKVLDLKKLKAKGKMIRCWRRSEQRRT
jgi:hypothetical protein